MEIEKKLEEMKNTMDALTDVQTVMDRILKYKEKIKSIPQHKLTNQQKLWLKSFEASEKNFSFETEEGRARIIEDIAILDEGIEKNETISQKGSGIIKTFIKKSLIFIALLILSTTIIGQFRGYYSDEFENAIIGIALSGLIVFVWNKISRKYLS